MQILVDTSIWVDHFRRTDTRLVTCLENDQVCSHPFIVGELACGVIAPRHEILERLNLLPKVAPVLDDEVLHFIDRHKLWGRGVGYVETHLLAAAMLAKVKLWTRDRRLLGIARELGAAL